MNVESETRPARLAAPLLLAALLAAAGPPAADGAGAIDLTGVVVPAGEKAPGGAPEAVAGGAGRRTPARGDALYFKNGDVLHGKFLGFDPGAGLHWEHPDAAAPIVFKPDNLFEVRRAVVPSPRRVAHRGRVRLTNGDELPGDIVSADAEGVVIDTWYTGRITLKRAQIERVIPNPGVGETLFEGPDGIGGWTLVEGQDARGASSRNASDAPGWAFRNSAFYGGGNASIGREFDLPDRVSIEFELAWKGDFNFWLALFSDRIGGEGDGGEEKPEGDRVAPQAKNLYHQQGSSYVLTLGRHQVALSRTAPNPNGLLSWNQVGRAFSEAFQKQRKARVELRVDRPKKSFALLVDGVLAGRWVDPAEEFAGKGKGVRFSLYGGRGLVRLSDLRIAEWDGRLETDENLRAGEADLVRLVNGRDRFSGRLLRVEDGVVELKATYADMKIPLAQVSEILLATAGKEPVETGGDVLQGFLGGGGRLTLEVEKIQKGVVICRGDHIGPRTILLEAFEVLRVGSGTAESDGFDEDF